MADQDKNELKKYIDSLTGQEWKGLAQVQYKQSIQKKSHEQAMSDTFNIIIETAMKVIENLK